METFLIGDLHFDRKVSDEENEYKVKQWNSIVKHANDVVYVLGDIGDMCHLYLPRLCGKKMLIMGNWDNRNKDYYLNIGFDIVFDHPVYLTSNLIASHEPVYEALLNPYVYNIHAHTHQASINLPNYFNLSGPKLDFIPQNVKKYAAVSNLTKNRHEKFMQEWYAEYYQDIPDQPFIKYNTDGSINVEQTRENIKKKTKGYRHANKI